MASNSIKFHTPLRQKLFGKMIKKASPRGVKTSYGELQIFSDIFSFI